MKIQDETAKIALEKGFYSNNTFNLVEQFVLQDWLRDVHKIHIRIDPNITKDDEVCFYAELFSLKLYNRSFHEFHRISTPLRGESYEMALEYGLVESLNKIK
jgi:hypothetical protein